MLTTPLTLLSILGLMSSAAAQDPRLAAPYRPPGTVYCDLVIDGPLIQATYSPGSTALQLTCDTTQATLGPPVGFYGGYTHAGGVLAADVGCHGLYYDIAVSLFSWKPIIIKFDDPTPTTTWYINPATNILQANKTSTYATTSTFIVCGPHYFLYLQTGSDIPPDGSCFTTQLQLSRINGPVFG